MKTSELEQALQGSKDWRSFCAIHEEEKVRLISRKDGAATSGDIGLLFDSNQVVVTHEQIEKLCNQVLASKIDPIDAQFIATIIALSGFEFDSEYTEDAVMQMSSPETRDSDNILEALQLLQST